MGGPGYVDGEAVYELDNFYECEFVVHGKTYYGSENYFQAIKAVSEEEHELVRTKKSGMASWSAGNQITLRDNWDGERVRFMFDANYYKFSQVEEAKKALLATGSGEIVFYASTPFWNKWNAKICTLVREMLRDEHEKNQEVIDHIQAEMKTHEANWKKANKV